MTKIFFVINVFCQNHFLSKIFFVRNIFREKYFSAYYANENITVLIRSAINAVTVIHFITVLIRSAINAVTVMPERSCRAK